MVSSCNIFAKFLNDNVVLLKDFILDWEPYQWNLEQLKAVFKDEQVVVKIGNLYKGNHVPKESDCKYENWNFQDIVEHLANFKSDTIFYYVGYHHIATFNKTNSEFFKFNWNWAGLPQQTADQSTIWLGSNGSFTPCHKDTYGCNLHAQLIGSKEWLLWPPDTDLAATRVPYEESSIFSGCDVLDEEVVASALRVVVSPGEVLFIPKHWWHFARNCELSFSINTWVPLESDKIDSLKEAISRILVSTLKSGEDCPKESWVNPGESLSSFKENTSYLANAIELNRNADAQPACTKPAPCFVTATKTESTVEVSYHQITHPVPRPNSAAVKRPGSTVDMLLNCILTDEITMNRICSNILNYQK